MSTYVVGDIQGCYTEFKLLLKKAAFDQKVDRLWLVGDLINRGPDNLKTIRYIMKLASEGSVTAVLGNHELHFLAVATGCHKAHRSDTFGDVLCADDLSEIIDWVRHLPLIHYEAPYVLVHAGIAPQWSIKKSLKRAAEVQEVLRSADYRAFLLKMYGNVPDRWEPGLAGYDRLRIITNYFTRMRYATAEGCLELTFKTNTTPEGFEPWFKLDRKKHAGLKILFGHWASIGGRTGVEEVHALDTGCVWGRRLTMMRLEDGERISVHARR